tara:strand:+ start:5209 stop:5658 length:450 start_codon:yes stop_codon:yes gene_type:complete
MPKKSKKKKAPEEAEPPKRLFPLSKLGQPTTPRKLILSRPKTPQTPRRKKPLQMVSEAPPNITRRVTDKRAFKRGSKGQLTQRLNREYRILAESERNIKEYKLELVDAEWDEDEERIRDLKKNIELDNIFLIKANEEIKELKEKLKGFK